MSKIRDRLVRYITVVFVMIFIAVLMSDNGLKNIKYRFFSNRETLRYMDSEIKYITNSKSIIDMHNSTEEIDDTSEEIDDNKEEFYKTVDDYDSRDAVNDTAVNIEDETVISEDTYKILKRELKCNNREYETDRKMRGEYYVLQNYAKAGHGQLDCFRYVTFVTHCDFTFIDNLEILVQKWQAPISLSLFAPGSDFYTTVHTVRYMKECSLAKDLINYWVSFHIFFSKDNVPYTVRFLDKFPKPFNCSLGKPHQVKPDTIFKVRKNLLYPVNVARNIARDACITHYFLSLDIELYPNPKLGARFLNMLAKNASYIRGDNPRVYALTPFEIEANQSVPENKTDLQRMLKERTAVPFHKYVCPGCHISPYNHEWPEQEETPYMDITRVGKRVGYWEPLFISTHSLPYLDERLSWDGMRDKMTQAYILCLLDYDFMILSNAFLVHRPGIKVFKEDQERAVIVKTQRLYINKIIGKEIRKIYGSKKECIMT